MGVALCAPVSLGAGRQTVEDEVDILAGLYLHPNVGEPVAPGEPIPTPSAHAARAHPPPPPRGAAAPARARARAPRARVA